VDWLYLAQDKGQCRALVNTVPYLQLIDQPGIYLASPGALCYTELVTIF
jgi:hypothetical protein